MSALDEEQQAALRKFKQDMLGVNPEISERPVVRREPVARVRNASRFRTSGSQRPLGPGTNGPTVLLSDIAKETGLKVQDLIRESRRAGIQLNSRPRQTPLFLEEADHLRRFAAGPARPQLLTGATYMPDPGGRISLKTYDRLDPDYLASLLAFGFLPSRRDVNRFPSRSWPGIIRHHRRGEVLKSEQTTASGATAQQSHHAASSRPESGPARKTAHVARKETPIARTSALSSPLAAEIKRQIDARRHRREIDPESKPEPAGIQVVTPRIDPLPTEIGPGSPALEELQLTLGGFAPKDHPVLFSSLAAALELDERNVRSLAPTDPLSLTEPPLRNLIRLICHGKFGLFAYHEVSNTLRSAARRNSPNVSPISMKNALTNLRPMHTGVLTDAGKSRFMFWHVEQDGTQLAVVTFGAMSDWVRGMYRGQYVPLRGRLITVSRHVNLTAMDREDAQFMVEAALKLRKGIHIRHSSPLPPEPRGRNYFDGATSEPRQGLRYKPHSDWLIPVVVEDGFATAGLEEGFFSNYGGKIAHEVRPFMRRAPGTSRNATKTVAVSAHTRGGYAVGDIGYMPTVTIMRELNAT